MMNQTAGVYVRGEKYGEVEDPWDFGAMTTDEMREALDLPDLDQTTRAALARELLLRVAEADQRRQQEKRAAMLRSRGYEVEPPEVGAAVETLTHAGWRITTPEGAQVSSQERERRAEGQATLTLLDLLPIGMGIYLGWAGATRGDGLLTTYAWLGVAYIAYRLWVWAAQRWQAA